MEVLDAPQAGSVQGQTGATAAAPDQDLPTEADLTADQDVPALATAIDLVGILSGVEETAYTWDMTCDSMEWESNVGSVLGVRTANDVATGSSFQFLIAAEHVTRRQSAFALQPCIGSGIDEVQPPVTSGHPYRVQYRFLPHGRRSSRIRVAGGPTRRASPRARAASSAS